MTEVTMRPVHKVSSENFRGCDHYDWRLKESNKAMKSFERSWRFDQREQGSLNHGRGRARQPRGETRTIDGRYAALRE